MRVTTRQNGRDMQRHNSLVDGHEKLAFLSGPPLSCCDQLTTHLSGPSGPVSIARHGTNLAGLQITARIRRLVVTTGRTALLGRTWYRSVQASCPPPQGPKGRLRNSLAEITATTTLMPA